MYPDIRVQLNTRGPTVLWTVCKHKTGEGDSILNI